MRDCTPRERRRTHGPNIPPAYGRVFMRHYSVCVAWCAAVSLVLPRYPPATACVSDSRVPCRRLCSQDEVSLYSNARERRQWDKLSEFFAILKTTEHLENARIKSAIGRDEVRLLCVATCHLDDRVRSVDAC